MHDREPHPRDIRRSYTDVRFDFAEKRNLPLPNLDLDTRSFLDVIENRRSRRVFGPVSDETLGTLFWYTAKTTRSSPFWQGRGAASAGGVHPIDLLIISTSPRGVEASFYDPASHAMLGLHSDSSMIQSLYNCVNDVVEIQNGVAIVFAAQFGRTAAVYANPESLVWRDAGALLQSLYLVGEALNLSFCGVGITCEEEVSKVLRTSLCRGVGACVVGSRVS